MRMYSVSGLLLGALVVFLSACEREKSEGIINAYPMKVGSTWKYSRQLIMMHYASDTSDAILYTDTMCFSAEISVVYDTIIQGTGVMCFETRDLPMGSKGYLYYFLDSEGLKCLAYRNPGLMMPARKKALPAWMEYADWLGIRPLQTTADNPLVIESPPLLCFPLPLRKGMQWTYREPNEYSSLRIDRKATGQQTITAAGETFLCLKVEYIYWPILAYSFSMSTCACCSGDFVA